MLPLCLPMRPYTKDDDHLDEIHSFFCRHFYHSREVGSIIGSLCLSHYHRSIHRNGAWLQEDEDWFCCLLQELSWDSWPVLWDECQYDSWWHHQVSLSVSEIMLSCMLFWLNWYLTILLRFKTILFRTKYLIKVIKPIQHGLKLCNVIGQWFVVEQLRNEQAS